MKRKNFRLGLAALIGLACYLLALSALLFESAGMPGGNGSGAGWGKILHGHAKTPGPQAENLPPHGKSHGHGFLVPATGSTDRSEDNPCLSAPVTCAGFDHATDGSGAGSNSGDSIVTDGQGSPFGGRNLPYPVSYGFPFFGGGGPAVGPAGGTGGSPPGTSGGSPTGPEDPSNGTPPGSAGSGDPLPPTPPGSGPPQIAQFFPGDPPGPGNPNPPGGTPQFSPSDPPPPSDPPGKPQPVPEPSSFWLLLTSLAGIAALLRHGRRSRINCAGWPRGKHPAG